MLCDGRMQEKVSNVLAVMTDVLENVRFTIYVIWGTGTEKHVYESGSTCLPCSSSST